MKISYVLHGINFEWESGKAAANMRKHGVAFDTACETFFDPFLRVEDAGIVEGEAREAVVGLTVSWRLLYVVYVMRKDNDIRITSARPGTETERKFYEEQ